MTAAAVADAACLIGLERIGRLEVIPTLYSPVFAPPAVHRELGYTPPWLTQSAPRNTALVMALRLHLGEGESEAIALAQDLGHILILDDKRARVAAARLSVRCIGTVGVLVLAKQGGHIKLLAPVLAELAAVGFFIASPLKDEALRLAGEDT